MVLHSILFFDIGHQKCTVSMKSVCTVLQCPCWSALHMHHLEDGHICGICVLQRFPETPMHYSVLHHRLAPKNNMLTKLARTHILSQSFIHSIPDEKYTLATRCFGKLPNGTIWFYKVGTLGCSSFWKVSSTLRQSPKLLVARSLASVTDSVMVDAFEQFLYIPVKQMQDLLFPLCNYTSVFVFSMYILFKRTSSTKIVKPRNMYLLLETMKRSCCQNMVQAWFQKVVGC